MPEICAGLVSNQDIIIYVLLTQHQHFIVL